MIARRLNKGTIIRSAAALFALVVVMQLVPYGRNHVNPPRTQEPEWDSPRTREIFMRACKNCHSNETEWPWYGKIAPMSWLVQYDVDEGRSEFNVSEWGRATNKGDEAAHAVSEGEMPPWYYLPPHPEARLAKTERDESVRGLVLTFGGKGEKGKGSGRYGTSQQIKSGPPWFPFPTTGQIALHRTMPT
jgi:mono/diheme cytochrome c family protein